MTYIICHQSKLFISFLNEWEFIPEYSAENWFYKKKPSFLLSVHKWCWIFQEDMLQNQSSSKYSIVWCALRRKSQRQKLALWLIHKRKKLWNHMIFNFKVLENFKQYALNVMLHCIWRGTAYNWSCCGKISPDCRGSKSAQNMAQNLSA